MYQQKKWAFLSDYVRFWALNKYGGIYFDTDVEVIKSFDFFLDSNCFIGFQDEFYLGGAVIGCVPNHWFTTKVLEHYENRNRKIVLPYLLTPILRKLGLKYGKNILPYDIVVYPKEYFYPFSFFKTFQDSCIKNNTYTIHRYDSTWLPKIVTKVWFPIIKYVYMVGKIIFIKK